MAASSRHFVQVLRYYFLAAGCFRGLLACGSVWYGVFLGLRMDFCFLALGCLCSDLLPRAVCICTMALL